MDVHFPSAYVAQHELETLDGVSRGKYTLGLGQLGMAVPGDREDVNALALSVVSRLLATYDVAPEQIGRLEVGTETLVDKSKSTKTVLMQLFREQSELDGATVLNACYGGTAALLNAVAWIETKAQHEDATPRDDDNDVGVAAMDFAVFHSPYHKLVQKAFARLAFLDARRGTKSAIATTPFAPWATTSLDETRMDRELDLTARRVAHDAFERQVAPSCTTSQALGNSYTAAVYINLATLVCARTTELARGARVLVFSYGSGALASMFVLHARTSETTTFSIEAMATAMDLAPRLARRRKLTPEAYHARMKLRECTYGVEDASVRLTQPIASIEPGAYYLAEIDDRGRRVYARAAEAPPTEPTEPTARMQTITEERGGAVYVAGTSVGLPGQPKVFERETSIRKLLRGVNCIHALKDAEKDAMLARTIVPVHKDDATGHVTRVPVVRHQDGIQVAAVVHPLELERDYGIPASMAHAMDEPTQLAVAAGLEALRNAGLVDATWHLPEPMCESMGIIYATSFPTTTAAVAETARFYSDATYEFDRKLLFRLLVLANAQVAQRTGARGPNTQLNAACAGTTQALGVAQDWIRAGKCARVLVIASDAASSRTLLPLIGSGFRALGAACTASTVSEAARPFDVERRGMILGGGALGVVLESPQAYHTRPTSLQPPPSVRLLASQFSNSAYHGASLAPDHIGQELLRFLDRVEHDMGITRAAIARSGVYYSHETGTNASATTSCAYAEVTALRTAFGADLLQHLVVTNTKGMTGHPMAVAFEDVAAIEGLRRGWVPPVVHFETHDPALGEPRLRLATGGDYAHTYALRFAAGFGSQLAFALYGRTTDDGGETTGEERA
ncbi:hypothetical protein PsorP6_007294 [Peronosclerospora sorghi]|uniref:Uncharacterized protein n=1 Tax=Peronosclerospora sorghi TaxID=230839 RepID=A0ACC0W726_9STRA|nr:hypothetical protein PsorP6_007294 [Peronosclerospora sorghi]